MKIIINLLMSIFYILLFASLSESYIFASGFEKHIYDATGYLNKNIQNNRIFIPIKILYQDKLLPFGTENIEINHLVNLAKSLPKSSVPYILDIECWDIRPNTSDYEANTNMDKYILVIKTMKEARPDLKFGYFGVLPVRDYVSDKISSAEKLKKWYQANERAKKLAKYVDVICPEFYTFWNNPITWKNYAVEGMAQAKIYRKPVLPFIYPEFMESTPLKGSFIPNDFWKEQLSFLYQSSDGVIIWGGRDFTVKPTVSRIWNENDPWWIMTKSFILKR